MMKKLSKNRIRIIGAVITVCLFGGGFLGPPVYAERQNPAENRIIGNIEQGLGTTELQELGTTELHEAVAIKEPDRKNIEKAIKQTLPDGAKLVKPKHPKKTKKVQVVDVDGDGQLEALAVYVMKGQSKKPIAAIFKQEQGLWKSIWTKEGTGYSLDYASFADVDGDGKPEILLGWTVGASAGNILEVYQWNDGQPALLGNLAYHRIEVEDMPGDGVKDGKSEIAVWTKDTGEAYAVEVYRWENGEFVPAPDVYAYYFPRVVEYYKVLVEQFPDSAVHWYYLADASLKSGSPEKAIHYAEKGKSLTTGYPTKKQFDELIELANQAK